MNTAVPSLRAHLHTEPGYRVFVTFWGGLGVLDVGGSVGAPPAVRLWTMVAIAAGCSVRAPLVTALLVGSTAWLLVEGFVVNSEGLLHWGGPADAVRLVLLLSTAVLCARSSR
jgi:hypothetical protein